MCLDQSVNRYLSINDMDSSSALPSTSTADSSSSPTDLGKPSDDKQLFVDITSLYRELSQDTRNRLKKKEKVWLQCEHCTNGPISQNELFSHVLQNHPETLRKKISTVKVKTSVLFYCVCKKLYTGREFDSFIKHVWKCGKLPGGLSPKTTKLLVSASSEFETDNAPVSKLPEYLRFGQDIDITELYRSLVKDITNRLIKKKEAWFPCRECQDFTCERHEVIPHVLRRHKQAPEKRITMMSVISNKIYTCICSQPFYGYDILNLIEHVWKCADIPGETSRMTKSLVHQFEKSPIAQQVRQDIEAVKLQVDEELRVRQAILDAKPDPLDDGFHFDLDDQFVVTDKMEVSSFVRDNRKLLLDVVDKRVELNAEHQQQVMDVLGISAKTLRPKTGNNMKRFRQKICLEVSQFLVSNFPVNEEVSCCYCANSVLPNALIQHYISTHTVSEEYGGFICLKCPICSALLKNIYQTGGYAYAFALSHLADCLIQHPTDLSHRLYINNFNTICKHFGVSSPYLVQERYPHYDQCNESMLDFRQMALAIGGNVPYTDQLSNDGEKILRQYLHLQEGQAESSDFRAELNYAIRTQEDRNVDTIENRCVVCDTDLQRMHERLYIESLNVPVSLTEFTRDSLFGSNPIHARPPAFVTGKDCTYPNPFMYGNTGFDLYMFEAASQLTLKQPNHLSQEERQLFPVFCHVYVFRAKAISIFTWLENNSDRVYVFPNSCMCWDMKKLIDRREIDPSDLTTSHRHIVVCFKNYSVYREFRDQLFPTAPHLEAAVRDLRAHGQANAYRFELLGKVMKPIVYPQHLIGVLIYVSRFKIPKQALQQAHGTSGFSIYAADEEENDLNLMVDELFDYEMNGPNTSQDSANDIDHVRLMRECNESSTSDHHQMSRFMSRHSKPLSYAFYPYGLTDWFARAAIRNNIQFAYIASNVIFDDTPDPPLPANMVLWPERNDLSHAYIPLQAARAILPGYISNHPLILASETDPSFASSLERLRNLGGIYQEENHLRLYKDHETLYVRLSISSAKKIARDAKIVTSHLSTMTRLIRMVPLCIYSIHSLTRDNEVYKIALAACRAKERESDKRELIYQNYKYFHYGIMSALAKELTYLLYKLPSFTIAEVTTFLERTINRLNASFKRFEEGQWVDSFLERLFNTVDHMGKFENFSIDQVLTAKVITIDDTNKMVEELVNMLNKNTTGNDNENDDNAGPSTSAQ